MSRLTIRFFVLILILTPLLSGCTGGRPCCRTGILQPDTLSLRADVDRLAAPEFEGRRSGTPGNRAAGSWLLDRIGELGLDAALPGGRYEQTFAVTGTELASLAATLHGPGGDSYPLLLNVGAPLAALDEVELRIWSEGHDAPASTASTLLLRRGPGAVRGHFSPSTLQRQAAAAGAGGLILLPHPEDAAGVYERYLARSRHRDPRVYALAGEPAEALLAYAEGEGAGELESRAASEARGWRIELPAAKPVNLEGRNLVARLPGAGPDSPVILLCAHYDHLGESPEGIFPGADDNASGVATLLETARLLAGRAGSAEIRFLFGDAEEMGLLGARAYLREHGAPDRVINLDSVGRASVDSYRKLRDPSALSETLMIQWHSAGGETAAARIDTALVAAGLSPQPGSGPMFERGGDHWAFAERGVPAHFLFGGFHGDYNTVSDLPERIRVDRLARLAKALSDALRDDALLER